MHSFSFCFCLSLRLWTGYPWSGVLLLLLLLLCCCCCWQDSDAKEVLFLRLRKYTCVWGITTYQQVRLDPVWTGWCSVHRVIECGWIMWSSVGRVIQCAPCEHYCSWVSSLCSFFSQCPFHGKIIPRDENGRPSNPADIKEETKETTVTEKPESTAGE